MLTASRHPPALPPPRPQGIDRATAVRIMGIWRKSGAADPDGLRKLFLKRSLNKSTQITLQLLVDAAAGAGAYYAARVSACARQRWCLLLQAGVGPNMRHETHRLPQLRAA